MAINPTLFLLGMNASSMVEIVSLANHIHAQGAYTPIVFAANHDLFELAQRLLTTGITCLEFPTEPPHRAKRRSSRWLAALHWAEIAEYREKLQFQYEQAASFFATYQPKALFVTSDRMYRVEPAFLKVAKRQKIPVVIVPYGLAVPEDIAFQRATKADFCVDTPPYRLLKTWIRFRYPNQVQTSRFGKLLFYDPIKTLALAGLDMLPPYPWMNGRGGAKKLGVVTEKEKQDAIAQGVPAEKVVVVGQASIDELFATFEQKKAIRASLIEKYGLAPDKKIIIFAVPQYAEHNQLSWEEHWQEIDFLMGAVPHVEANVLLSLHPKSKIENYRPIAQKYHVQILEEPMKEVLAGTDIHLSAYSTTAIWASLLKIPAVVFDFDDRNMSDRYFWGAVIEVRQRADLNPTLQHLVDDPIYYQDWCALQAKVAEKLPFFDGKNRQRILDLMINKPTN